MDSINWRRMRDILLSIVCLGLIIWAIWIVLGQFVVAIVILLLAMAVAFLLTPIVHLLGKYGVPRVLAAIITYIIVFGSIAGLAYELVFSLVSQINAFSATIAHFAFSLPTTLQSFIATMERGGIPQDQIHTALAQVQLQTYDFASSIAGDLIDFVTNGVNVFLDVFLIAVLSFYLTLDGKRIRDNLIKLSPEAWLPNVLIFEDALIRVVGNYIRGQLTLAVLIGLGTGLICLVVGLGNYALICGVLAFLFETIPMVGPALASLLPLLLSMLIGGPQMAQRTAIIIVLFITMQALESNVLGPRIVGRAVGLHPVAAILSLLVGAKLFGVFGALLATPIVAAAWVVVVSIYRSAHGENDSPVRELKRDFWSIQRTDKPFVARKYLKGFRRSHINLDKNFDDEDRLEELLVNRTPFNEKCESYR